MTATADQIAAIRSVYEANWPPTDWTLAAWAGGAAAVAWLFAWWAKRKS